MHVTFDPVLLCTRPLYAVLQKKREKKRRLDNAVAGTSKIRRFCLTTTASEDETSEGNPENSKRDAVDVAPSVPAHEDEPAAEPSPENKAAAVPTTVTTEPATVEPATAVPTTVTAEPATTWSGRSGVRPEARQPD